MTTVRKPYLLNSLLARRGQLKPLRIRPTPIVFYTVFAFAYLLSGAIILLDLFPYRLALVSLLVLPLFFSYGIKPDSILFTYSFLAISVILSGIFNNSPVLEILLFLRILAFSYLIYYLVEVYINKTNINNIIRLCIGIAIIQLPVIVVQQLTYDFLPEQIKLDIVKVKWDFAFGTFRPGDSALNFFLNLLIIFLLFDNRRNFFIRYRPFLTVWLSLTVLVSSSEISKVTLALIWVVYFFTSINRKTTIYLGFILLILLVALIGSGLMSKLIEPVIFTLNRAVLDFNPERVQLYLEGSYARGAALYYFLTNDVLWFGDGPSKYSDPISGERLRGNMGHFYTFYSEVGLIGWILSVLVFFLIAFRPNKGKIRFNSMVILMFVTVQILSFTNNIMNDISVVLVYCILAKSYLLPVKSSSSQLLRKDNFNPSHENGLTVPSLRG